MNHFPKRLAILIAALLSTLPLTAAAQAPPAGSGTEIRGRILDAESREPVHMAEVALQGTAFHTMTDQDGRFVLRGIPAGTYALRATRLGYAPLLRENVLVRPGQPVDLELPLERKAHLLEEITVTPGTFSFMGSGTSARQTMSRGDLESVPQIGEDLFRAVNRLPGLSSSEYSAHFSIRGGRHDETLILLDGLELYEPYHLKDFNEGAISIVDVEAIDGVELMTGGFPAQFGNKRSGVFDITSRTPETDRTRYSVGLSLVNARAMARGPLWKGRGSWLASARSGYLDLVFRLLNQNDLPSPRYHDVFAKLQVDLNAKHVLSFDLLHAGDRYTFNAAATTGFLDSLNTREDARNRYGNSYLWGTLASTLGARTSVRNMVSASLVTRSRDGSERYVNRPDPIYAVSNKRDYTILGFKQDWTHGFSDAWRVGLGADVRRLHNDDRFTSLVFQDPDDPTPPPPGTYPVTTNTSLQKTGTKLGLYLSNRMKLAEPLILEVGGRYDEASYTGDRDFSPRTSAALVLGQGRTLRVGWGHYRQIQGIDEVAVLNQDSRYFPSELSRQWTAGLEQRFAQSDFLRAEVYFKRGSDGRPIYRNWKGGTGVFREPDEDRILVYPSRTTSRGAEIYYDRKLVEKLSMRASYALSVAEEEVDQIVNVNSPEPLVYDRKHPMPQDQRHAANVDFAYRWRPSWSFNGSFVYHSGWPATLEQLVPITNSQGGTDLAVKPIKIYGARLPSYLRFDMRATRRWTTSFGDMRLFAELVNLTNHKNAFGYDYFKTRDALGGPVLVRDLETWFTILPAIGVAWSTSF